MYVIHSTSDTLLNVTFHFLFIQPMPLPSMRGYFDENLFLAHSPIKSYLGTSSCVGVATA